MRRELEKGEHETAKLMFWEQPGYGVRQPHDLSTTREGGSFLFKIRGVPEREIRLETFRRGDVCRGRAYTTIDNQTAVFQRIEIDVSGWANVHRVEIFGVSVETGSLLREVTHQD
jgi:hypothetical protein